MPTKDRLLVLLQTLQEKSDDETWLTTADLRSVLEKEGYECSIRTLRRDMQSLPFQLTQSVLICLTHASFSFFPAAFRRLASLLFFLCSRRFSRFWRTIPAATGLV